MRGFEDTPVNWAPVSLWTADDGTVHQTIEFIVPGHPIGQGNMIKGKYGNLYDKTKGLRPWREMVTTQARNALAMARKNRVAVHQFSTEVGLHVAFVQPRPASAPKTKPLAATKKSHLNHDLDKLVRAIQDSLTDAGVWEDDAQVVEHFICKRVADYGESPGAHILVTSNVRPAPLRGLPMTVGAPA